MDPRIFLENERISGDLFIMQKHSKIRNVPFPRPCGATGNDARKLHARAKRVTGETRVHSVLGGFHLMEPTFEQHWR